MAQRWLTPPELEEVIRHEMLAAARDIREGHRVATMKEAQPAKQAVARVEMVIPITVDDSEIPERPAQYGDTITQEMIDRFATKVEDEDGG